MNKKTGSADWQLQVNPVGRPEFWLNDGTNTAQANGITVLNDGNWHYIVGVWNGGSNAANLYVDASADGNDAIFLAASPKSRAHST